MYSLFLHRISHYVIFIHFQLMIGETLMKMLKRKEWVLMLIVKKNRSLQQQKIKIHIFVRKRKV